MTNKHDQEQGPGKPGPDNDLLFQFMQLHHALDGRDARQMLAESLDDFRSELLVDAIAEIAEAFRKYVEHEVSSLDDAFGVSRPAGYRRPAARKRFLKRKRLQRQALWLRDAGAKVDPAFFEVLGTVNGVKPTQAKDWYYELDERTRRHPRAYCELMAVFREHVDDIEWVRPPSFP